MTDELFDFGFSDAEELVKEEQEKINEEREKLINQKNKIEDKAHEIYEAIEPFLDKLRETPEKAYIHWPNRVPQIDKFQERLVEILNRES